MINKFDSIIIWFGKASKTLAGDLENSSGIIRRENLNNTDEKFAKYEDVINKKEIDNKNVVYTNKTLMQLKN